jgi:hypothetical protein
MSSNSTIGQLEKIPFFVSERRLTSQDGTEALAPVPYNEADRISVASSDPTAVSVVMDSAPVEGAIASGYLYGGKTKKSVSIIATVTHGDGMASETVQVVDCGAKDGPFLSFHLGVPALQHPPNEKKAEPAPGEHKPFWK